MPKRSAVEIGSKVRVAIVGAGFGGLSMAKRLEDRGIEYVIFERAKDLGGTWRDNTYPGCKCDVQSALYSFSFDLNPNWSHTFPEQEEIFAYMKSAATKMGAIDRIRFNDALLSARWDAGSNLWTLVTESGTYSAEVLILAIGPLSQPRIPEFAHRNEFEGVIFHTARWDHNFDFRGKRIAVVGTGASSIQLVPKIQPLVEELLVLQRTPPWVLPHGDRPLRRSERFLLKYIPPIRSLLRLFYYLQRELLVFAFIKDPSKMSRVRDLALGHLRAQVPDPELVSALTPEYDPGCKRLLLSNDYYPALQRPNVRLVRHGLLDLFSNGVVYGDDSGTVHREEVDGVIFATGFMATDNPMFDAVIGRNGISLSELWGEFGMQAYKGTTVPGFPNLFLLAGPNTGIGHTSLVTMIQAQVRYVMGALGVLDTNGGLPLVVKQEAFRRYNDEVQRRMSTTVWTTGGCGSWYLDSKGNNTTLWPDFTFHFLRRTRRFDSESYEAVSEGESMEREYSPGG